MIYNPPKYNITNYFNNMDVASILNENGSTIVFNVSEYESILESNGFFNCENPSCYYKIFMDKILLIEIVKPSFDRTDCCYVYSKQFLNNNTNNIENIKDKNFTNSLQFEYCHLFNFSEKQPIKEIFNVTPSLKLESYEEIFKLDSHHKFKYTSSIYNQNIRETIITYNSDKINIKQASFLNKKLTKLVISIGLNSYNLDLNDEKYITLFENNLAIENIIAYWNNSTDIKSVLEMEHI